MKKTSAFKFFNKDYEVETYTKEYKKLRPKRFSHLNLCFISANSFI